MKNVYFACSIRGGRDDAGVYAELVDHIKKSAHVVSEIFADSRLNASGMNAPSSDIWKKDTDWIRQSDVVIAEVTNPSLGVGYEIALAESLHMPILALFRNDGSRKLSAMIDGAPGVQVCNYGDVHEAHKAIDQFIAQLTE